MWQHPGKSVFFYAKNRAPPWGSAQETCCARRPLSAPKSSGNPRDIPRLPRGAVSRVCAYACAVARVCAQGARRCLCRGACMRVGVFARRARGGARSRRRSRRFCRKSVDPSGVPALPARGRAHKYAGHTPGALQNTFLQMKRKTTRFPGAWHRGAVGAP